MKCHKPNSDQEASVEVFANGYRCPEYAPKFVSSTDQNTVECFIPVSDGEKITIKGNFKGTVIFGSVDLLADGSFLADTRIENRNLEAKMSARKIDIQKVFDMPEVYGPVVEGDLYVKPQADDLTGSSCGERGVGCLVVIISVTDKKDDTYEIVPGYTDLRCGGWKERNMASGAGIAPTHELSFRVSDDDVHKNRQSRHRRHAKQLRGGPEPWAKFIFYYRSISAIENAGCLRRMDASHALQPKPTEDHVVDSIEGANGGVETEMQTPVPVLKKGKLFGQPLFPPKPAQSQEITQQHESPANDAAATIPDDPVGSNQQAPVAVTPTVLSRKRSISPAGTSHEGTPNKKPRLSERKAAFLARIEEKKRRNEEAKEAAEAAKKLYEEEQRKLEEKELEELEELERIEAEMDEEFEELRKQRALAEGRMEELKENSDDE